MFKLFIAFLVCILFCVNVEAAKIAPVDTITTFPSSEESESSSDFSIGQKVLSVLHFTDHFVKRMILPKLED